MSHACQSSEVTFIQRAWSDHLLVSATFHLYPAVDTASTSPQTGDGIWRAHPRLASSPQFCLRLHKAISAAMEHFTLFPISVQDQWDELKRITIKEAKKFSRREANNIQEAESLLQKKRSGIDKTLIESPDLAPQLRPQQAVIVHQLASVQQHQVDTLILGFAGENKVKFLLVISNAWSKNALTSP
jgi:hypothetical protein